METKLLQCIQKLKNHQQFFLLITRMKKTKNVRNIFTIYIKKHLCIFYINAEGSECSLCKKLDNAIKIVSHTIDFFCYIQQTKTDRR